LRSAVVSRVVNCTQLCANDAHDVREEQLGRWMDFLRGTPCTPAAGGKRSLPCGGSVRRGWPSTALADAHMSSPACESRMREQSGVGTPVLSGAHQQRGMHHADCCHQVATCRAGGGKCRCVLTWRRCLGLYHAHSMCAGSCNQPAMMQGGHISAAISPRPVSGRCRWSVPLQLHRWTDGWVVLSSWYAFPMKVVPSD
jgi:hypothetical protein